MPSVNHLFVMSSGLEFVATWSCEKKTDVLILIKFYDIHKKDKVTEVYQIKVKVLFYF